MRSVHALLAIVALAHPIAAHAEVAQFPIVLAELFSNPTCAVPVEAEIAFEPGSVRVYSADRLVSGRHVGLAVATCSQD